MLLHTVGGVRPLSKRWYRCAWCFVCLQLAGRVSFSYQGSDFVRPISEGAEDTQGLRLSQQELAMYLDLGPYANPSYYVVQVGFPTRPGCSSCTCS
jgi:hypothetical protein